jgi:hypothetical protein
MSGFMPAWTPGTGLSRYAMRRSFAPGRIVVRPDEQCYRPPRAVRTPRSLVTGVVIPPLSEFDDGGLCDL